MKTEEGRVQKAIRLLTQTPFELVDHGKYQGGLPENFTPKLGEKHWNDATAVMAVIRSRPGNWRWTAKTIQSIGRLSDRVVRRGVHKLKAEGWVHHGAIYDERRKSLTTFILAFTKRVAEHRRESRSKFTLLHTEKGWLFGYSRDGERYTLHDGVAKKRADMHVQQVYEHSITMDSTQTLKRAQTDFSIPSATQPETTQCDSPTPATQEPQTNTRPATPPAPPKEEQHLTSRKATASPPATQESQNTIDYRKHLTRKLEQLGEQRDESEDAALRYEEFVATVLIPELSLPEKSFKPRRKIETLTWVENSLLGQILLRMSSSSCWDVKCARRIVRRANEGYINFCDVQLLLFAFDWTRDRRSRKTLEAMTYYGTKFDESKGAKVTVDAWKRMIRNAKHDYRQGILGPVLEQRNRLFPQSVDEMSVNWGIHDRVGNRIRAICTREIEPDEQRSFHPSIDNPLALAYLLSRKGRSEKIQKMVDEGKDLLETYFATDYAGILLYRSHYHVLPDAMGLTLDGIKQKHRERVDKIQRRLSYHGYATDDIRSLI